MTYGSKYEQRKQELIRLIHAGELSGLEIRAEEVSFNGMKKGAVCYFCVHPIKDNTLILLELIKIIKGREVNCRYYLHNLCYYLAINLANRPNISLN